jgi:hypothetical protein
MTDTRFEEFHKAVAPTVQVMRDLTNAIMAVEPRHKHRPEQGSEGAGELDFQEVIEKKTSWDKPITDTHSMGGVALLAATDYARGFAELFDGKRTPVFGHLALARAALEAATVAGWLGQFVQSRCPSRLRRHRGRARGVPLLSHCLRFSPSTEGGSVPEGLARRSTPRPNVIASRRSEPAAVAPIRSANMHRPLRSTNPPKVHPPGKGAPNPQLVRVAARSSRAGPGATSCCGRDGSPHPRARTGAHRATA